VTDVTPEAPLVVLAVDDEAPALDELVYLLRAQDGVGEVLSAGEAMSALRILRTKKVDAVFLDINMPGLDGVELAGILAEFAVPPPVVFVTAHDNRAVEAFDVGAVDYLLKPVRRERLAQAVQRIRAAREQKQTPPVVEAPQVPEPAPVPQQDAAADEVIPVELGGVTTLVRRSSVGWVEADGDYARLHTSSGSHLVRIPLATLEQRWGGAGFLRVHRSYLVALRLVTGIRSVGTGYTVTLRGDRGLPPVELPVSRRHTRELKDKLVRAPMMNWQTR
jgi:two-component system response regulator LytT